MTLYCEIGDKPKVIYRISGDTKNKIFQSEVSPIDVSVVPFENPNLPNETYAWNFSTTRNPKSTLADMPFRAKGKLTNFRVTGIGNIDTVNGQQIAEYSAEFRDGNGALITGSAVGNYPGDEPRLVKLLVPGDKPPSNICQIRVKDSSGKLLFSDSGKCSITYKVACGNCPPNQCEHKTNAYPGYCCVNCSSVRDKLNSLTNKAKRKHG